MLTSIRLNFVQILICVVLLPSCGAARLQTPSELIEQIKKGGKYDSEKRCDQHLRTSIEYQYCRQEVRKVYDEVEGKQKERNVNIKLKIDQE